MRTFTDALACAQDVAEKDAARTHYKDYVSTLIDSLRKSPMILDNDGKIVSARGMKEKKIYGYMTFTHDIVQRYGLISEGVKDGNDLDHRLDRAIKGLETEIGLKQANCERLMQKIKENES